MKPGDRVTIYRDPTTRQNVEGEATLVERILRTNLQGFSVWGVRFDNDSRIFNREIYEEGPQFSIGDKVQWTHVSSRGRTTSMTTREGEIIAIDGEIVTVRKSTGRQEKLYRRGLRLVGQRSQLTDFVETVFEANRRASADLKQPTPPAEFASSDANDHPQENHP